MYTGQFGMVSAMVRRAKGSSGSGGQCAAMQPLSLVEVELNYREDKQMQNIRRIGVHHPWKSIQFEPGKVCVAMFLGEFLWNALRGEGVNGNLFDFICRSLEWFDESVHSLANFHLVMLLKMTRFLGFWPSVEGERARGRVFDMLNGCFAAVEPVHGQFIGADEARLVPLLLKMNYMQMWRVKFTRNERRRMLDVIVWYYRLHVPGFRDVQSLEVLKEVFD